MEGLTRLVSESFARHGFDRPLDYRRLQWSRWFACESPHSLLVVPSKPGVFAVAEKIMNVGTAALSCPAEQSSAGPLPQTSFAADTNRVHSVEERPFRAGPERAQRVEGAASSASPSTAALAAGIPDGGNRSSAIGRMLAVLHFGEDDDMAFVLDRMFTRQNPLRDRLASGRCFLRYVIMEDASQRRRTCHSLNQWLGSQGEMASGIASHFAASLELKSESVGRSHGNGPAFLANAEIGDAVPAATTAATNSNLASAPRSTLDPSLDSGFAKNFHCPQPFPSGF